MSSNHNKSISKKSPLEELHLHSFGKEDHLETIKKKYEAVKNTIQGNSNLSENEKQAELKNLSDTFKKAKKDSESNLY